MTSAKILVPLLAATLVWAACGGDDGPSGPSLSDLQITVVAGDGQFAGPGEAVKRPLRVVVQDIVSEEGVPEIDVRWEVVEGAGATLSPEVSTTDSLGRTSTTLTLGSNLGVYRVQASFSDGDGASGPVFTATAARAPEITRLPDEPVDVGDTIVVEGRNFSSEARDNEVLFAGLLGIVTSATATRLEVVVPACVPSREVDVVVRLGKLESQPATLAVLGGGGTLDLAPGEALVTFDSQVLACIRLPAIADSEYILVPHSASRVGGGVFPYRLQGFGEPPGTVADAGGRARLASSGSRYALPGSGAPRVGAGGDRDLPGAEQHRFERRLRVLEDELAFGAERPDPSPPTAPPPAPEPGDRATFNVVDRNNEFRSVTAEVVRVSQRAVIYEDLNAPSGGLTSADYTRLGELFDDPIFATDVDAFGEPSDIDGNGLVTILFTPMVNSLTEEGSDGFIAGFFFGCDLVSREECSGSNRGEIFYAMVPDPDGEFGDARSKETVLDVVPAVIAHEFQHMIHFNQRVLLRGANSTEALWLSEGLAHMAEDLVGDAFLARGDTARAGEFKLSNFIRGIRYLEDPDDVSLIASTQFGSLEERGAAWLFTRYIFEHFGRKTILRSLTQTTRTSVANVETQTGEGWRTLVSEWAPALYVDGLDAPVEERFTYPDFRLRVVLGQFQGGFPLNPPRMGFGDFLLNRQLAASGTDFILLRAGSSPQVLNLNIADRDGGPLPAEARAQATLIRLR